MFLILIIKTLGRIQIILVVPSFCQLLDVSLHYNLITDIGCILIRLSRGPQALTLFLSCLVPIYFNFEDAEQTA